MRAGTEAGRRGEGCTFDHCPGGSPGGLYSAPLLYTSVDAAELLAVPESWLRRKAGRRLIPCTLVGKHLRFSAADLAAITAGGSQPVLQLRRRRGRR